ncbi:hypothetical protein RCL1_001484 [Eukaryota sp. TZLM3-RCL]
MKYVDNVQSNYSSDSASIQSLIEDLRHDEEFVRTQAMERLCTIAIALGPTRTREDLIPYLVECTDDDSDTVLVLLANRIAALVDHVGGANHAHTLLQPLQLLMSQEEVSVKDAAVESFNSILKVLSPTSIRDHVIPIFDKLFSGFFSTRSALARLLPLAYKHGDDSTRQMCISYFHKLANDSNATVRRSTIKSFADFLTSITSLAQNVSQVVDILKGMIPILKHFSEDEQDSVRLFGLEACAQLTTFLVSSGERVSTEIDHVFGLVKSFCSDRSWRVRYVCGDVFIKVVHAFSPVKPSKLPSLLREFKNLLTDVEQEVRSASSNRIIEVGKALPVDLLISELLPQFKTLATDESAVVRTSFAPASMELCSILPLEVVKRDVLPVHRILLRDSSSDVRLAVIAHLKAVYSKFNGVLNDVLFPAISVLASDNSWRIRLKLIELMSGLADQFDSKFFKDNLLAICCGGLSDPVCAVRDATITQVAELCRLFGDQWTVSVVLPQLTRLSSSNSYLFRITLLRCLSNLASFVAQDVVVGFILPLCLELYADRVPNVRLNVVKTLKVLANVADKTTINMKIVPVLQRLSHDDGDNDVRFFANDALKVC